jgi:hypothetical protein
MLRVLMAFSISYFMQAQAFAGNRCGGTSSIPEIIPCPPKPYVSSRPKCDKNIPVHIIRGEIHYFNEFMGEEARPCELNFKYFPANVQVKENLATCEVFACDPNSPKPCVEDILLYPFWVNTITATEGIARQQKCERRRYVAEGCFVEGSEGRIFVANRVDYDTTPVTPETPVSEP